MLTFHSYLDAGGLTPVPLPTNETMIDIDSYGDLSILVGNNGTIVHFNNVDNTAQVMPSGTTEQLLNVEVIDAQFAMASGSEVVLLWNGNTWSTVVDFSANGNPNNLIPVWAPPEKNKIFFQDFYANSFSFLCTYDVTTGLISPFCKGHQQALVKFCGRAGDFKALQSDGSIVRFSEDSFANNDSPTDAPVYELPIGQSPYNIMASYIFEESCVAGNIAPTKIYAVSNPLTVNDAPEFIYFDGSQWNHLGFGQPGEVISGIEAVNENHIVAVGSVPSSANPNTNEGVAYLWEGSTWTPQTLPAGTEGIPDLIIATPTPDVIFVDTYEQRTNIFSGSLPGCNGSSCRPVRKVVLCDRCGSRLFGPSTSTVLVEDISNDFKTSDLMISKTLVQPVSPLAINVNDVITYRVKFKNLGPAAAADVTIKDVFYTNDLAFMGASCDFVPSSQIFTTELNFKASNVLPGVNYSCDLDFTVLSLPFLAMGQVGNLNTVSISNDDGLDPDKSQNKDSCLLDSPAMNQPANRVRCHPEMIWQY